MRQKNVLTNGSRFLLEKLDYTHRIIFFIQVHFKNLVDTYSYKKSLVLLSLILIEVDYCQQ